MHINDLDTPSVTIDLDIVERNIARLQEYCDEHGIANRPHIKTHKLPYLAHKQLQAGAVGITCQKIGEAEVMAEAGCEDILITFNILGKPKLERLRRLVDEFTIGVVADSTTTIEGLSQAMETARKPLRVLVECDTGGGRVGVQTPSQALELAQVIARSPGLRFGGLMTYPTRVEARPWLQEVLQLLKQAGLEAEVVSGGGSPGMLRSHLVPEVTELRAGTYIYNDRMMMGAGAATVDDCAMRIISTVVSRPTEDRGILDGGSKTFASDRLKPEWGEGYGLILEYPDAVIYNFSEEHGHTDFSKCKDRPVVGERVTVIPNHTCVVTNLHNHVYGHRNGEVEHVWDVAARGLVQ